MKRMITAVAVVILVGIAGVGFAAGEGAGSKGNNEFLSKEPVQSVSGSFDRLDTLSAAPVLTQQDESASVVPVLNRSDAKTSETNPIPQKEPYKLLASSPLSDDIQFVEAIVGWFDYPEITVEVNKPVRINFKVTKENLNSCNDRILIPSFGIEKALSVGDNYVEFTPVETGVIPYSCWMDMIRSKINVVASPITQPATTTIQPPTTQPATVTAQAVTTPLVSAGDTNSNGNPTIVEARIAPGGYPQIVVEVGVPVRINFKADSATLNACNNEIFISEWNISKKLSVGDNYVEFTPTKTGTFSYSCWMGMLRSSITVVEKGAATTGALAMDESANYASDCCAPGGFSGGSSGEYSGGYPGGCGMMSRGMNGNGMMGGARMNGTQGGHCIR